MGENQSKPLEKARRKKKPSSELIRRGARDVQNGASTTTDEDTQALKAESDPFAGIEPEGKGDRQSRRENILTKSTILRREELMGMNLTESTESAEERGSERSMSPFLSTRDMHEYMDDVKKMRAQSEADKAAGAAMIEDALMKARKRRSTSLSSYVERPGGKGPPRSLDPSATTRSETRLQAHMSRPKGSGIQALDALEDDGRKRSKKGDERRRKRKGTSEGLEESGARKKKKSKSKSKKRKKKSRTSSPPAEDEGGAYLLAGNPPPSADGEESSTDSKPGAYIVLAPTADSQPTVEDRHRRERERAAQAEADEGNAYLYQPPVAADEGEPAGEEEESEDEINWSDMDSDFGPESRSDDEDEDEDEDEEGDAPNLSRLLEDLKTLSPQELYDVSQDVTERYPKFLQDLQECLQDHFELKQALGEDGSEGEEGDEGDEEFIPSTVDCGDWNSRFQSAIIDLQTRGKLRSERMRIYSELSDLAQDFINTAKTYGRIIISEVETPMAKKTIKPVDVGGFAGGEKYIVNGILFKFAVDEKGLFGSDEAAIKVAGHELKGLISYFNLGLPDVHFPLMALVDYLGFRLSALSVLPIRPDTIVYGSADAGKTMHAKNELLNKRMADAARFLRLKPHMAGLYPRTSVELAAAGDIEGHEVDGLFYLLDFSRAFPPSTFDVETSPPSSFLYRLLRPEFLRKYDKPLCPDAYSGFVRLHGGEEHITEVEEATSYLLDSVIPAFAEQINNMNEAARLQLSTHLKESLHNEGINMRYLGNLRQHVVVKDIKHALLVEMIARVIKHQIRIKMRNRMHQLKGLMESAFRRLVVDHFNLVFESSAESTAWWDGTLKEELEAYFPNALSDQERLFPLKRMLYRQDLCNLFKTVLRMTHVKLNPKAEEEFSTNGNVYRAENGENPFDVTYVEEIEASVRHMNIVALAQGYVLKSKARVPNLCGLNKTRLCRMAIEKFTEALSDNPGDKRVLRELADSADIIGEHAMARMFYRRAIHEDPTDPNTLFKYAVFLEESMKDFSGAEEVYLRTLEHNPDHDHCLQRYADFLESQGNYDSAEQFYIKAAECRLNANRKLQESSEGMPATSPSGGGGRTLTQTSIDPIFF